MGLVDDVASLCFYGALDSDIAYLIKEIIMPLFRSRKTKKLEKRTARQKEYLSYYRMMMRQGRIPITQHQWMGREKPVYFKTILEPTIESRLRGALTEKEITRLKRKRK